MPPNDLEPKDSRVTATIRALPLVALVGTLAGVWWFGTAEQNIAFADVVGAIAWPGAVVALAWIYRDAVRDLVKRLREFSTAWVSVKAVEPAPQRSEAVVSVVTLQLGTLERKILQTFWTKQVNRIDEWPTTRWTFRPECAALDHYLGWMYWAAVMQLYAHGLIVVGHNAMITLTEKGLAFCAVHHAELDGTEWWPDETIDSAKEKRVIDDSTINNPRLLTQS